MIVRNQFRRAFVASASFLILTTNAQAQELTSKDTFSEYKDNKLGRMYGGVMTDSGFQLRYLSCYGVAGGPKRAKAMVVMIGNIVASGDDKHPVFERPLISVLDIKGIHAFKNYLNRVIVLSNRDRSKTPDNRSVYYTSTSNIPFAATYDEDPHMFIFGVIVSDGRGGDRRIDFLKTVISKI